MLPNPEVRSKKATRRRFSAADKARIIAEYDDAKSPLERAAVLRREAVYTSHIANWRKAPEASSDKPRGAVRIQNLPR